MKRIASKTPGRAVAPVVVAHYMPWFQTPAFSGSWGFWQVNRPNIPRAWWHDPERRNAAGWRDLASVFHPVIGPYDSSDPDLCEYHILLARLAGIDAFVADWYGPDPLPEHPYENTGFTAMLRAAEKLDFKVMLCWEDQSLFPPLAPGVRTRAEAVVRARSIVPSLDRDWFSSPAYLRLDGRPVLTNYAWGAPGPGVDRPWFTAVEWECILAASACRPVFIHDWQIENPPRDAGRYESFMPWGNALHGFTDDPPGYWESARAHLGRGRFAFTCGTVLPGFDNRGCGGWGAAGAVGITPRRNGEKLARTWDVMARHRPRFIQIATWNDFNEGGTIEPVRRGVALESAPVVGYGYRELETVQAAVARMKGEQPDPKALRLPALLYACRKLARAAGVDAAAEIERARALLLAGRTGKARERLAALYETFPETLRLDPDLALHRDHPGRAVSPGIGLGWAEGWSIEACHPEHGPRFTPEFTSEPDRPFPGRRDILTLHAASPAAPCRLSRPLAVPAAGASLAFSASADAAHPDRADFVLRVRVDGETLLDTVVSARAGGWRDFDLALDRFNGRTVSLVVEVAAGGEELWAWETAYLASVRLERHGA